MVTVGLALLAMTLGIQEGPDITVGIRPSAIRAGDLAVVTVRVRSGQGSPNSWIGLPRRESSWRISEIGPRRGLGPAGAQGWTFEREYTLRGDFPGTYQLPPVQVVLGGQTVQQGVSGSFR